MTTFGTRMREAREAKALTLVDVVVELRARLPRSMWVSQATLQRMEAGGTTEQKADPFLVTVLATIYGTPVSALSQVVADDLDRLRDLLGQATPCNTTSPDLVGVSG